jgi:hypothetical protein
MDRSAIINASVRAKLDDHGGKHTLISLDFPSVDKPDMEPFHSITVETR